MRPALLAVALLLAWAAPAAAAPSLVKIGDFDRPMFVTSPPNETGLFVVEKGGTIQVVGGGTFLDISSLVNGSDEERGLLSMAFSPSYATDGRFYVFYTAADPNGEVRIVEYRRSANPLRADPGSARPIFTAEHPQEFHNGGQLQFGPDGMLYASIGDALTRENAQDTTNNPYGKILRINPSTGAWGVWSYGLRNPWRFSFDRATGDIAIGDVGEGSWEEIDWDTAPNRGSGVNFGWPTSEGFGSFGRNPIIAHNHSEGFRAIVGGYVVRDPGLPTLRGRYIYGDYAHPRIWSAVPRTGADDRQTALAVQVLTSFGEDGCGHIYVATLPGPVYRLQDGAVSPCTVNGRPADTTPPGLAVRLSGVRNAVKKRRLLVSVRCSEACQATIGTRLKRVRRLATRHRNLAANQRKVVRLKLSKATAKRLRKRVRRRGFVRVRVSVRATDAAGNVATATRRGRIKRRR